MFKTWLTESLGIKYPIIQGGMLWLSRAELASAVSNAGGLGVITAGSFYTGEELRQEIRKTRSLTDKPFAVNIAIMPHRKQVNWEEFIVTAIEEGIKIFETSGRSPEPYMPLFKQAKVRVLHKVVRIRDAKTAERVGADAVIVFGFEGGGHPGVEDVASLVLTPKAADTVNIPVIAAGGFGDGRGLVAALALGAEGVVMGTRFMVSQECPLHPAIKEKLLQTQEMDTMIVERSIRNSARVIKTEFALKVLEMEQKGATIDELFPLINGERVKQAYISGNTEDAILYCSQAVGLMHEVRSVREIIDSIVAEAEVVAKRLRAMGAL
ncbi:MAG: nitronate monooxygenase [Dehalococcoidales bacterium]|nr:nitronate monooxygenase [Dehalococcoidales bacterium]